MIKPPKIFVYYFIIALIFVGLSYIIPKNGFQVGASSYKIKWFSFSIFASTPDSLLLPSGFSAKDSSDSIAVDSAHFSIVGKLAKKDTLFVDTIKQVTKKNKIDLCYPPQFKSLLYSFFQQLKTADSNGKVIRILHMGDSQIEGDRITKFLRERFQEKFGGCGPGLIPVYDPQKQFSSVWITNKGKWVSHVVYHVPRLIKDNQYGLLGCVSMIDSSGTSSVKLSRSFLSQNKAKSYYKSRLFLKNIAQPIKINAYWEDNKISSDTLLQDEDLTEINWTFKQSPKFFSLDFESHVSPIFLGMSLDSLSGVAVDNISMRGQSTPRLEKNNLKLIQSMSDYLNIGMVILQYGTNMVPTITDNYEFYTKTFYDQLKLIKKTMPGIPVVVVGVGDVATLHNGKVQSYHHVFKIKEAQKLAALKAGCAFFDLYEAMGGEGAMIKWVNNDPKYALSDYTHFNKSGGKKVAEWIYTAIMNDYNSWNNSTTFNN